MHEAYGFLSAAKHDRLFFAHVAAAPELKQRLVDAIERRLSPYDVVSPLPMLGWLAAAAARGNLGPVPGFLAQGRRVAGIKRDVGRLQKALARVGAAA